MLNVILYQPEIPPNTGNIIRLCANTATRLHLIGPLGFTLDDRRLRRAGLDYHEFTQMQYYDSWQEFKLAQPTMRVVGVTTRGTHSYHEFTFNAEDGLLMGRETAGLPDSIRTELGPERLVSIPMKAGSRSLNLSNATAIVLYEAWRQLGFEF